MKVIFLDIDGVLQPYNSEERFNHDAKKLKEKLSKELNIDFNELCHEMDVAAVYYDWDKDAIRRIKTILDITNSKIVISSDWRSKEKPMKMPALLKIQHLDKYYVGQTDDYGCFEVPEEREKLPYRTIEILNYLDNHKEIINYVVIDDQLREEGIEGHFVETYKLINDEQMNKCIEILGKDDKEKYSENILEKCLPGYLENDLKNLKEGLKNNVSYIDCLIDELQGSINSAWTDGDITEEQCDYLYKKYVRMEKENG